MGHELRVRIKTLVVILVMVVCANVGDLMLKRGMTQIGAVGLSRAGLEHAFRLTVTNGTISPSDIASNTAARVSNFTAATGMTLTQSNYALFSEMYADISYLNFFSVLSNPTVYVRSVS